MGATPRWIMMTLLLSEGTREKQVRSLFDGVLEACCGLGIELVGGHTEVMRDLPRSPSPVD